jgi:hypothetical protein
MVSFKLIRDSQDEGQFSLCISIFRMITMLVIYPIILKFNTKLISTSQGKAVFDGNIVRYSILCGGISITLLALSNSPLQAFLVTPVEGLYALSNPTVRSLLSNAVPKESQGILFSGI